MDDEIEESDWSDYETGPFCIHWSDPWDCEEPCTRCGHECKKHSYWVQSCSVDGCECEEIEYAI